MVQPILRAYNGPTMGVRVMPEAFDLHPRLAADCAVIGDLPLCRLLLMDDASYPWCILVPRRAGVRELHELDAADRAALLDEVVQVSALMQRQFSADKMNVAAFGNVVPQLHVHVIARHVGDPAWPRPVWGAAPPRPYAAAAREEVVVRLRGELPCKEIPCREGRGRSPR